MICSLPSIVTYQRWRREDTKNNSLILPPYIDRDHVAEWLRCWTMKADYVGSMWVRIPTFFFLFQDCFFIFYYLLFLFIIIAGSTKNLNIIFFVDVKEKKIMSTHLDTYTHITLRHRK